MRRWNGEVIGMVKYRSGEIIGMVNNRNGE